MTTAALASHVAAGSATLCWCVRVDRADGVALGFTDHDADIAIGGFTFRAATAISPTELRSRLGVGVDFAEIAGAFDDASLTEADLAAGRFDGAHIAIWRVNWADPAMRMLVSRGEVGEVTRGGPVFQAEFRSLSMRLNQPVGRVNSPFCDADLGDARCRVDLSGSPFRVTGTITAVESARRVTVAAANGARGYYAQGELVMTGGALAGDRREIRFSEGGNLDLWESLPALPAIGDACQVIAGCDKQHATCRDKFANAINFQGNPYQSGDDIQRVPDEEADHDGGSRFQ